jgi:hypothetical protein
MEMGRSSQRSSTSRRFVAGILASFLAVVIADARANAQDASEPVADPGVDPPTMHALGAYWVIGGDDDADAGVELEYRVESGEWRRGMPLWRVERGAHRPKGYAPCIEVPEGAWLFAGSVLDLAPGVHCELRLTLRDPDGGEQVRNLSAATTVEPTEPAGMRARHVAPGSGGGDGSPEHPLLGLAAADAVAKPGDLLLVHAGVYAGPFVATASGTPAQPIVWRAAGDGEAIIDGGGEVWHGSGKGYGDTGNRGKAVAIRAEGVHDLWFERLSLRRANDALVANRSARLVIRGCRFSEQNVAISAARGGASVSGFFIADNVIAGPAGPAPDGPWDSRGIELTGIGHEICYNRISGMSDDMIALEPGASRSNDVHHNDLSDATEGIEMDCTERNSRCSYNRMRRVFHGVSLQPVYGGPVYVYRNDLREVSGEAFKLHNHPSGVLMLHNTAVRAGSAWALWTSAPVSACRSRGNLFIGTTGKVGFDCDAPMTGCDFDRDGFSGSWTVFLKWNKQRYATIADAAKTAPAYQHAVAVEAEPLEPSDLEVSRLRAGSAAVDAGEAIPGLTDGFAGTAPDLGAHELGSDPPRYGPRDQPR